MSPYLSSSDTKKNLRKRKFNYKGVFQIDIFYSNYTDNTMIYRKIALLLFLARLVGYSFLLQGPLIINSFTGVPWQGPSYRSVWLKFVFEFETFVIIYYYKHTPFKRIVTFFLVLFPPFSLF